ncbi:MAG: class I SAM-dependent methyltransferase [Clostridiaceae bacterium]|jgi:16S rRNA (guanine1207-N2)-methyltransferase|nr:class I SAM-dependent methyltransferase [Clostridiaceae bacterium]
MDNNEHYFTEKPTSELKERNFTYKIKNEELSLTSVSGVFAFESRVDRASELLIKAFRPSGSSVLDLGCGYGAVGLFIKALYGDQQVCLSDINERAIEYSMLNASSNKLDVKVVKSDLFSALSGISFDDIVTNPPIAAGKKLLTSLIEQACEHLNPGGALWMVAYHNKGGASLKKIMQERFTNVEDVEKSGGIRVYRSVKSI